MHGLQRARIARTRGVLGHAPSGKFWISGLLKSSLMQFWPPPFRAFFPAERGRPGIKTKTRGTEEAWNRSYHRNLGGNSFTARVATVVTRPEHARGARSAYAICRGSWYALAK